MVETRAIRTILGYRKDGRPIFPIMGGAEDGGDQGGAGGDGGQGGSGGTGEKDGAQGGDTGSSAGAFDHITDPAELRAVIARLTREAGDQRTKSRDQVKAQAADEARKEMTQSIAKALGLAPDEKADPAELQRQIATLTTQNQERDRELAIYRAALAPTMNVDAGRLLDSRAFMRSVADIDPNAGDADEKIREKISAAVSSDASLKSVRVNGGGSVGHAGGAGDHNNPDLSKLHGPALLAGAYAQNAAKGS